MSGLEIAAQLHIPYQTSHYSVNFVWSFRRGFRVVVVVSGGRHEVGDRNDPRGRAKNGLEDVGVGYVLLPGLDDCAGRADSEMSADVRVKDGGEDAGGIESRKAAPVDGAVGSDKRRRGHVAYKSVVVHG